MGVRGHGGVLIAALQTLRTAGEGCGTSVKPGPNPQPGFRASSATSAKPTDTAANPAKRRGATAQPRLRLSRPRPCLARPRPGLACFARRPDDCRAHMTRRGAHTGRPGPRGRAQSIGNSAASPRYLARDNYLPSLRFTVPRPARLVRSAVTKTTRGRGRECGHCIPGLAYASAVTAIPGLPCPVPRAEVASKVCASHSFKVNGIARVPRASRRGADGTTYRYTQRPQHPPQSSPLSA
jgi:hypothetical protein